MIKPKRWKDPYAVEETEYVVKEGDTPQSIAKEFLDDENAAQLIYAYNNLLPEEIVPGVKIYFPKYKN